MGTELDSSHFPTSMLKNLLQNSDLLEILLKPISNFDFEPKQQQQQQQSLGDDDDEKISLRKAKELADDLDAIELDSKFINRSERSNKNR
jgi:hypothetical protein